METFRKLYNKLTILFCLITTFIFMINSEAGGIGYACLYIFAGLLCFGVWSIGRKEIDPEKIIRTILLLLLWSMLGFGMMAIGVASLIGNAGDNGLVSAFLILTFFALIGAYVYTIIKNKDLFGIISVSLFVGGVIAGIFSEGIFFVQLLSLLLFVASIGFFVVSLFKGTIDD